MATSQITRTKPSLRDQASICRLEELPLEHREAPVDPDAEVLGNVTYYGDAQWGSLDVGTEAGVLLGGLGEGISAGGEFVKGGPCHHPRCPAASPETGCPL